MVIYNHHWHYWPCHIMDMTCHDRVPRDALGSQPCSEPSQLRQWHLRKWAKTEENNDTKNRKKNIDKQWLKRTWREKQNWKHTICIQYVTVFFEIQS